MPGPVEVLLHQDLRDVVADLRAHHARSRGRWPSAARRPAPSWTRAAASRARAGAARRRTRSRSDRAGRLLGRAGRPASSFDRARVGQREAALGERRCASRTGSACRRPSSAPRGRSSSGSRARRGGPPCLPKRFSNACIVSAERSSLPPPLPKMPPISDASAITSVASSARAACRARRTRRASSCGSSARLGDVGVDAGDVLVDVLDRLLPACAVELRRVVDLLLQVRLGVRRDLPLVAVHRAVAGAPPTNDDELGAAGVAQDVHEEQAVLRRRRSRRRT